MDYFEEGLCGKDEGWWERRIFNLKQYKKKRK
jgi:hypothetical protein